MLASAAVETVLLALKIAFVVLLYLFVWRIVRSASRDLRLPLDTLLLGPSQAHAAGLGIASPQLGRLVVEESPSLEQGTDFMLDSIPLTLGRAAQNDVVLAGDEFASARHARVEPRRDGIWVHDLGSTNGTYVNGERLEGAQRLAPGDVLRVGETDLRYEE